MTVQALASASATDTAELLPPTPTVCADPDCILCQVAAEGARAIAVGAGLVYDDLDQHAKDHYAHMAKEVFAAMSEKLIELEAAIVTDPGEAIRAAGQPSEETTA